MAQIASPRDRRNVTVLFVDIVGSTLLIEKADAERVHRLFTPAIKMISSEVERFSGRVAKVMGDGLMAVFGVPYTLEDHATRASRAALAIQERIGEYRRGVQKKYGVDLQVRVGLNSGSVVVSVAGEGDGEIFDVLGSPVHLASRIESQTPAGSIGMSNRTYQLTGADFECRKLGSFTLKGFSEPEEIYQLLRARDHPLKEPSQGTSITAAPMVGRHRQCEQLYQAIAKLNHGRGGMVLVTGDAGSGKTRFMNESKSGPGLDLLWLEGQSSSYDQRISYWPFIEILRRWLTRFWQDNEEWNWTLLETCLDDLFGTEAEEVIPYVATLMGMDVPDPYSQRVKFLERDVLSRQILRAMRRLFERTAAKQAVIIVIEDFHWADDSSVELVEHLLGLSLEVRVLICVTTRPDGVQAARLLGTAHSIPGLDITEIELPPLEIEQSIELLERLVGKDAQSKYLRDQILYKAGGNPFFIEEVVNSLIASGALVSADKRGGWTVKGDEVFVPDTIRDVVMARVDRLDARLKEVLNIASVIGQNFLYTVVRAMTSSKNPVDQALGELGQLHFIDKAAELPELLYRFRHGLMQEAVYESILLDKLKTLHERVADCLLEIFSGRTSSIASVLAFHYARADQSEKALRYLLEAADHSIKVAADAEALKYYEEALNAYSKGTATPWEPWQKAMIECRLGEIHFHRGNLEAAQAHYVRALDACDDPLPKTRRGWILGILHQVLIQIGHRARGVTFPALASPLQRLDEVRLQIYESLSWLLLCLDQEKMGYAILKILNICETSRWAEGVAKAASGFGAALNILGLHAWAQPYHARALEISETGSNPPAKALVFTLLGLHDMHLGRWDDALERIGAARALASQTGDLLIWTVCTFYRATILNERGAFARVLEIGEEMIRQGRESAFEFALRTGPAITGPALWRVGAYDQAQRALEDALKHSMEEGDYVCATHVWGELGLCLLSSGGNVNAAAEQLDRADLLMRQRKVRTFSTIPIFLGLAEVGLAQLESNRSRRNTTVAMRRCRGALKIARRFCIGLPRALRLMGTLYWLNGHQSVAERWWQESLAVARNLGARYEAALTHIEIGVRKGSAEHKTQGEQWLAECRALMSPDAVNK